MHEQTGCLISVIIPVHNATEYLHTLMRCILYQTLPLDNIQVLLLNNASTDGSEVICREYAEKYGQIQCIELTSYHNVNYVRNLGMSYAGGKYITFLDSNDLWSLNAFGTAVAFLDRHYDEIDAVHANVEFFGQTIGRDEPWIEDPTDYIFDITTDYRKIITQCAAYIIKTEVAKEYQFDEMHDNPEGTGYINRLLFRKKKFGWLSEVVYYKKIQKDDMIDAYSFKRLQCGNLDLDNLVWMINNIHKAYGSENDEFAPIVQYLAAYLLTLWVAEENNFNKLEMEEYQNSLNSILNKIDDCYLFECCNTDEILKLEILVDKYHLDFRDGIKSLRSKIAILPKRANLVERKRIIFNLLKSWFVKKNQGKSLLPYFHRFHWSRIAVYGMSDLGRLLCDELRGTDIVVQYAIDTRADNLVADVPVYSLGERLPKVDVIVVTAVFFFKEIVEDLEECVECPVISFEDMIYAMS